MIDIRQGNSVDLMKTLPDNSVDLWVTSPPYAKQRNYGGASSSDYIDWITPFILEAKRTLKDSGSLVINIKEHCDKGQRDLYVYKLIIHCVEGLGLRFVDEYIWVKTNPFPTGSKKRMKDGFERILHFTKTNNYKFNPNSVLVKSESKWLESEKRRKNKGSHEVTNDSGMNMSRRIATDMVRPSNVITGTTSNANIGHPAVYPSYIPNFFIKLLTDEGDVVGDMFYGSGTSGIEAIKLDRSIIGFELNPDYFQLGLKRTKEAI